MAVFRPATALSPILSLVLIATFLAGGAALAAEKSFPGDPRTFFEETADFSHPSVARIQGHLAFLDDLLRDQVVGDATPSPLRQECLDHLAEYRERGLFPQLPAGLDPTPVFIDESGTACAVGYLMIQTGARELAETIAREDNFAYLEELAARPQVVEWARQVGLSLDECAMIQPTYCSGGAPTEVEVVSVGNDLHFTWVNQDDYDYIQIFLAFVGEPFFSSEIVNDGNATTYVYADVPWGELNIEIGGACDGGFPDPYTFLQHSHQPANYLRSDTDGDGSIGLSDGIRLLDYLFAGGEALECEAAGDVDGDAALGLPDAIALFAYVFLDGPEPGAPFPDCGEDPEAPFSCVLSSSCP